MDNKKVIANYSNNWQENSQSWQKLNFSVPIEQTIDSGKDFLIKGTAINSTVTRNGVEFISEELQVSAASLRNKPILKDHTNSVDSIVGRTTQNVNFNSINSNIDFEAKIMDEPTKEKLRDGRIQHVSVGAMVSNLEEALNDDGEVTHLIAKGIDFVELSLVAVPADPNAGLAQAIKMSFDLKKKNESENGSCEQTQQKMDKVETKIEEKVKEETKVEEKTDISQELMKTLNSISERLTKIEETQTKVKVEEKVEEIVEEKVKDETIGEVGKSDVEESTKDYEGFNLERNGRMFSFSANDYPSKFKRLNRGK